MIGGSRSKAIGKWNGSYLSTFISHWWKLEWISHFNFLQFKKLECYVKAVVKVNCANMRKFGFVEFHVSSFLRRNKMYWPVVKTEMFNFRVHLDTNLELKKLFLSVWELCHSHQISSPFIILFHSQWNKIAHFPNCLTRTSFLNCVNKPREIKSDIFYSAGFPTGPFGSGLCSYQKLGHEYGTLGNHLVFKKGFES